MSIIYLKDVKQFLINDDFPQAWKDFGSDALITELLQKPQILTDNFVIKNILLFTFIPIYFFLTVNLDIKTLHP